MLAYWGNRRALIINPVNFRHAGLGLREPNALTGNQPLRRPFRPEAVEPGRVWWAAVVRLIVVFR